MRGCQGIDRSWCLQVLTKAKQHMGEILSAFEFFDNESLQLTVDVLPHIQPPLKFKSSPFYAIVETAGSNDKHDQEKFQVHFSPCSNISRTSLILIRASHHPAKIASKTILLFLVDKHCNLQALQSRAVFFRLEASQAFSGLSLNGLQILESKRALHRVPS